MTSAADHTDLATLRRCWRQWTEIIGLFARRRRGRRRVDPRAYGQLHHELVTACRALADRDEPAKQGYYQGLLELVQPWLNIKALADPDQEILCSLLSRCRRVEEELGGHSAGFALGRWAFAVLVVLAVTALLMALGSMVNRWDLPGLGKAEGWCRGVWLLAKGSGTGPRLIMIGLVPILLAIRIIARSVRS